MTSHAAIELIGYFAATLTTISFVPQLVRVLKFKSAQDISLTMFLIFSLGTASWLVYGLLSHSAPVTVANAITFSLSLTILMLKLRYDAAHHAKPPLAAVKEELS